MIQFSTQYHQYLQYFDLKYLGRRAEEFFSGVFFLKGEKILNLHLLYILYQKLADQDQHQKIVF